MVLTREEILKNNDIDFVVVDVSEWGKKGDTINIITISAGDRDDFEAGSITDKKDANGESISNLVNFRARLVAKCAADDDLNLIFDQQGDVELLTQKSGLVVDRLYTAAVKLNKMQKYDVDDTAKN
ncbi:MAG: hypothetical protein KAI17_27525 [Thiotrichaceae bacterium]|nr:hypothetical protein [Thiotrichaceae bacterium]